MPEPKEVPKRGANRGLAERHVLYSRFRGSRRLRESPTDYPRTSSTAFGSRVHADRQTGRPSSPRNTPGKSGFAIIRGGRPAFTARVVLADLAQRTLDVQYFLWESDATGRILVDRLVRAADRGVRVRILVDDVNLKDRDAGIAALDAHPNIEIRLFNPFAHRGSHLFGFLIDFARVNHRMHNKLMVMDNALAIVGGRNMSDPYFEVDPRANFRDLDIAAAGPVVRDLSKVFDRFWNGEWSVPIAALVDRPYERGGPAEHLQAHARGDRRSSPIRIRSTRTSPPSSRRSTAVVRGFVWAPGHVVYDDPAVDQRPEPARDEQASASASTGCRASC